MGEKVLLNSSEIKKRSGNKTAIINGIYQIKILNLFFKKGEIYTMKRKINKELTKEMLLEYGIVDVYYDNEL